MGDNLFLIDQCLRGNRKAQKELYEEYAPVMLGICYRYTRSLADAEDMLQEGFVRVFKNLHQFKGTGNLGGWIRRIMVNTVINELRRSKLIILNQDLIQDELLPSIESNTEFQLTAKEIASMIQMLPEGYRIIFNLFAIEGYSYREIAELMHVKEVTVRSQYLRARNQLIRYLEKAGLERKKPVENG